MAGTFKFDLVSPEKQLISDDVEQVVVPGSEGDFAVLVGHAPFMSTLRPGVLEIMGEGSEGMRVFVRGGFAEVDPTNLTVLAESAFDLSDVDADQLSQEIAQAEADIEGASSDEAKMMAQLAFDKLTEIKASL